jgi:hypothetical protein
MGQHTSLHISRTSTRSSQCFHGTKKGASDYPKAPSKIHGGEGGIRTPGTPIGVQQISNLSL